MKSISLCFLFAFAITAFLAGCRQETTPTKEYDIKGKVVSVAADKKAVTLNHEDIPGLMKGMQMEFQVEDPKVLEGIQAGDQVQGRLKVDNGKYVITRLEKR